MQIIATNTAALLDFIVPSESMASGKIIPAFDFLLFNSIAGELRVTGSNGQTTFIKHSQVTDDVYSVEDGELCIEANKLVRVLRTMSANKPVNISSMDDTDKVLCKCARSRIQLATIPASQYPTISSIVDDSHSISLPISSLISTLRQTAYAAAKNDARHYLNAVLLECDDTTLRATSSDGHRLSTNSVEVESLNVSGSMRLLLPTQAVHTLLKLSGDGDILVRYDDNKAEFVCGNAIFRSQLIDGNYPDVKRLIPTIESCKNSFSAEKGEILEVVKRLSSALVGEKVYKITLAAEDEAQIHCSAVTSKAAESVDWISGEFTGSVDFRANFNANLILDAVSHIESDNISMYFNDMGMMVLKDASSTTLSDCAIVMPTR